MKTPQIPAMPGMTPLGFKEPKRASNEKTVAERQWQKPKLAPKPQKACDHGLFSDDANQTDLPFVYGENCPGSFDPRD